MHMFQSRHYLSVSFLTQTRETLRGYEDNCLGHLEEEQKSLKSQSQVSEFETDLVSVSTKTPKMKYQS
jgi:hypothetical protein